MIKSRLLKLKIEICSRTEVLTSSLLLELSRKNPNCKLWREWFRVFLLLLCVWGQGVKHGGFSFQELVCYRCRNRLPKMWILRTLSPEVDCWKQLLHIFKITRLSLTLSLFKIHHSWCLHCRFNGNTPSVISVLILLWSSQLKITCSDIIGWCRQKCWGMSKRQSLTNKHNSYLL